MNITGKAGEDSTYDAIVVGSGISGGWAAKELTQQGLTVLLPERGGPVEPVTGYPTAQTPAWELRRRGRVTPFDRENYPMQGRVSQTTRGVHGLPVAEIDFEWKDNELKMAEDMVASAREMLEAAGCTDIKEHFGVKALRTTAHEMGTARMGRDPRTSVLNPHNQVWGCPNVYVTDGACMTSNSCVNPSLKLAEERGTDSYVGMIVGSSMLFSFDFGYYSGPIATTPQEYLAEGDWRKMVTYRFMKEGVVYDDSNQPKVQILNVRPATPEDDSLGKGLDYVARCSHDEVTFDFPIYMP